MQTYARDWYLIPPLRSPPPISRRRAISRPHDSGGADHPLRRPRNAIQGVAAAPWDALLPDAQTLAYLLPITRP